ncbi:alpha-1,6- mannanase [Schizosaccharomyces cryophilus OY26]|uniref:Alpha-1,6-mannanase n=1 Tax=Schizosaccharomyces cryophilus (strain OY26 / ATCC MYA-4695 / CBS 11777 / NBRC 106824 / NRRL Y48691) TaxID=653667 RepID=S9VVA4_SCHCR|nr:alpha-1,6- mannanase [Schizosaccharomyces cryophilus OY26]EPY51718.1 alpha-1,6- mannanase [Schizosaccharomyces cryophilus OY26]
MTGDNKYLDGGLSTLQKCFKAFFDKHSDKMGSSDNVSGTYNDSGSYIYLVWSVAVYAEAMADTLKFTNKFEKKFENVFQCLKRYWSPEYNACCASYYFQGNNDVYFDDNAQVAIALATAGYYTSNSSRKKQYLDRAEAIISFLINRGWNQQKGGVAWHVNSGSPPGGNLNACSTAMSALAALRLAFAVDDNKKKQQLVSFAWNCVEWIHNNLVDNSHLVCDGLSMKDGKWTLDSVKFTYNTGATLASMSLLLGFEDIIKGLPNIGKIHSYMENMAEAALNTKSAMYDQSCKTDFKTWKDNTFFAQHLAEGLMTFSFAMPTSSYAKPAQQMVFDQAEFIMKYIRDPKDGLYFRDLNLYKISQDLTNTFNKIFHANQNFQPDKDERIQGDGPVEKQPLCKSLIGSSGAARMLFPAAEIKIRSENPQKGPILGRRPSGGKDDKSCFIC